MKITSAADAPLYDAGNLREGTNQRKVLATGKENHLGNFRFAFTDGDEGQWKAPRHRHNFEQIRLVVSGKFEYAEGKTIPAGGVGYFPESVHYGPQVRHEGLSLVILQFGGPSG